jgi:hypothetical protein
MSLVHRSAGTRRPTAPKLACFARLHSRRMNIPAAAVRTVCGTLGNSSRARTQSAPPSVKGERNAGQCDPAVVTAVSQTSRRQQVSCRPGARVRCRGHPQLSQFATGLRRCSCTRRVRSLFRWMRLASMQPQMELCGGKRLSSVMVPTLTEPLLRPTACESLGRKART